MNTLVFLVTLLCLLLSALDGTEGMLVGEDRPVKRLVPGSRRLVYFKAFLSKDTAHTAPCTVVFGDLKRNDGNAYNKHSGVFSAPVKGLYEFKSTVQRRAGRNADIAIVKQDMYRVATVLLHRWEVGSMSAFLKLNKGDHVRVKVVHTANGPVTLREGIYTQFSGYLIREL